MPVYDVLFQHNSQPSCLLECFARAGHCKAEVHWLGPVVCASQTSVATLHFCGGQGVTMTARWNFGKLLSFAALHSDFHTERQDVDSIVKTDLTAEALTSAGRK